ncbi:MAG: hypothetical protein LBT25_01775 [Candidatus Symbiothrix sp.]|jgi:hypothetical protein|nr:hypothetical protein [Candidatus Symbiothrix sp.]
MTIIEAVKNLANDNVIMDSYTNFDNHKQYWIFSKNRYLMPTGQASKPPAIPSSKTEMNRWWRDLKDRQKRVLYSSLNKERYPQSISEKEFDKIKKVYDKWPLGDIAAFGGAHVEIVTSVDGNSFCSIGAERGSGIFLGLLRSPNGVEVCGYEIIAQNRYIDNDKIKFRRV